MAFVYKYVDNNDNVVYVGKVKSDDYQGLIRRHKAHLYSDDWCTNNLKMYYFETKSHADADMYETFFISYYNQRHSLFNKAKLWGKSDLDLECSIDWIEYEDVSLPRISEFDNITQSKERLATFIHTITVCRFRKGCEGCELNKYGCDLLGIMEYLNKESATTNNVTKKQNGSTGLPATADTTTYICRKDDGYMLRNPYIAEIVQNAPKVRGSERIVTYKELHNKATSFIYAQEHSYTIKQIIAENQLEILQKYGVFVVDGAKGKDGRGIRIIKV